MKIPFFNLERQHDLIKKELDSAIESVLKGGQFVGGDLINKFEEEFAKYCQQDNCIGVANGTDAIELSLRALNIGEGDEVIVPALTWIADADAVSSVGAKVVFADLLETEFTIDPQDVRDKLTNKTKAVIAVHLYGHACRMNELNEVLKDTDVAIIEDCAQAHGTTYNGFKVGRFGVISTYSFYPSKNLGALGDAGAVLTNDVELSGKIRLLANHGQPVHNEHLLKGRNSRLDTLQAAVLSTKLKYLDKWVTRRRQIATQYINGLSDCFEFNVNLSEDAFHLFVIKTEKRDELKRHLEKVGVGTAIHYPKSLPETKPYKAMILRIAQKIAARVLSLPIYPELTDQEVAYIISTVKAFYVSQ